MYEATFALLKPEAAPHVRTIVFDIVLNLGLHVQINKPLRWKRRVTLAAFVDAVYVREPEPIQEAIVDHWCGYEMPHLTISGTNALERFLEFSGTDKNPKKCAVGTLRRRFGSKDPPDELDDQLLYYRNGIHRPETLEEMMLQKEYIAAVQDLMRSI